MGLILFIFDKQIFNKNDFTVYAVKLIDEKDVEFLLGPLESEMNIDNKFLDGTYSLKIYSKGIWGPIFFSSTISENRYYRFTYATKQYNTLTNPIYFLI